MAYPLAAPYNKVTTAYGITGSNWKGCGFHTGADLAAPNNEPMLAAIAGTIRHRNYGSSFGPYQFSISPSAGQPFADDEVFYAHGNSRLADGTEVQIGDFVGKVGSQGNATGPHIHFEWHVGVKNGWPCDAMANPQTIFDHSGSSAPTPPPSSGSCSEAYPHPTSGLVLLDKLVQGQKDSDSVWYLQRALNSHSLAAPGNVTLPLTGCFLDQTATVVRACQQQHGYGDDPMGSVYVGAKQAAHLGLTVQ